MSIAQSPISIDTYRRAGEDTVEVVAVAEVRQPVAARDELPHPQEGAGRDDQPGFLAHLAHDRLGQRLAMFLPPARQQVHLPPRDPAYLQQHRAIAEDQRTRRDPDLRSVPVRGRHHRPPCYHPESRCPMRGE